MILLFLVLCTIFIVPAINGKGNTSYRQSVLVKDGILRYEDENHKKKDVDLTNIDNYLNEYKSMKLFDGITLTKHDYNKKSSASNLEIDYEDKKMALKYLYKNNYDLYNRLCAFLEDISDKDMVSLEFRLNSYIKQDEIRTSGKNAALDLRNLYNQIKDEEIRKQLNEVIDNIKNNESQIDSDERYRRLYENYLTLLVDICKNYALLEKLNNDPASLSKTKKSLLETLALINAAFGKLEYNEEPEAETTTVEEVLNRN